MTQEPKALAERIHPYLTGLSDFGYSGAALVAQGGAIILNRGYGYADRERDIPNTAATVFDMGSIGKQFTAVAIMQLSERGTLRVDDTLSQYFPEVPPEKAQITLHQILTHTAGLVDFPAEDDFEEVDRDDYTRRILNAPLEHPPGEVYAYSNAGYTLLGMIVEKVSGQPYREYLQTHLFEPAHMVSAGWYGHSGWQAETVAHGYVADVDQGSPFIWPEPSWVLLAAGGVVCTVEDLYRWHVALQSDAILGEDAKAQMYTPEKEGYAYGWEIGETDHHTRIIGHNGASVYGFSANFRRFVDDDIVVVVTCNADYNGFILMDTIADDIAALIFEGGDAVTQPPPVDRHQAIPEAIAGTYSFTEGGSVKLSVNPAVLTAKGQHAINPLAYPQARHAEMLEIAHRMETLAGDLTDGKLTSLPSMLARPERIDFYSTLILENLSTHRADHGALTRTEVLGSIPYKGYDIGAIRLYFEDGSAYTIRPAWAHGQIAGFARLAALNEDIPTPLRLIYAPHPDGGYVTYNLLAKNATRFRIEASHIVVEG